MKPKVLLVDDEADFRQLIEYNLTRQEFDVFTAANGLEALNEARRLLPDVILLDLMLPDLDGFTVRQLLHAQPSTANVPVIIVSALDGQWIKTQSSEQGAPAYFRKPVDFHLLGNSVRAAFARQHEALMERMTDARDAGEGVLAEAGRVKFSKM